jgi:beta-lactamase regulating signal transducer with metallopeptidase domain/tetratricopeptide (TPR) repeat protein
MNAILEQINSAGFVFVSFALPMLVQSSILIVVLLLADLLLRKKVRAVVRYWLWMLVLIKLVLPTNLSSPVSLGYWFGDKLTDIKVSDTSIVAQPVNLPQITDLETAAITSTPLSDVKPTETAPSTAESVAAATPSVSLVPLTWQGIVFLVWVAVVTAMGLLLLQRAIFVTGLVAQAQNPTQLMKDAFGFCCGQMELKSKVGLKVSANTASPAVCGLFRPVILVPQNLAPTLGSSHLRMVLLHELAHIKRGDLWLNLVQTILQIIYFYNPLLWLANSIIRRIREQAVDEAVQVAMGANAPQYPKTLVDVAKIAFNHPVLSLRLIGVVESKTALKGRIERMLNRPIPKSAKLGVLSFITLLIFAVVFLPMAKAKSKPPEFIIKGTVTDAHTGRPVAGAKVGDDQYAGGKQWTTTDANGFYSYSTWYEEHNLKCEAPGYKMQNKLLYTKLFGSEKEKVFDFALEHSDSSENISDTLNQPSSNQNYNEFEATLPNGVTIELIGICEHPSEGKHWWRPDGTALEKAPYSSRKGTIINSNEEFNRLIEIAVELSGTDLQNVSFACKVPGATRTSVNGVDIEGLKSIACEVSKLFNSGQVNVRVADGSWETIFVRKAIIEEKIEGTVEYKSLTPGHWLLENSGGFINWDVPLEKDGKASIKVAHSYGEYDSRVVARDRNGNLLISSWSSGGGADDLRTTEYRFPVSLAQIDEFQLQIRPYQWVTFSNVSLKPGVKTDVHIEQTVGGSQQQSAEELHKLLMEHRDIFQKKLQTVEMEYNAGRAGPTQLRQAKIDLLWVESKLSETPQKRIDILEQIVSLYLEQEKQTKILLEAGRIAHNELYSLKLPRLNAEEELARAKADLERAKLQNPDVQTDIKEANKVSDKDKMASENLAAQGWKLWRQRKLPEAEEAFEKAVSKDPTNANAWNGLGWAQQNQGKPLNAKASFEKCLKIQPKHAAALNGLGWIAKAQGKTDEAITHWEKAIEAAPDATAALNGLATTYMELKQFDKAIKYYQMWLNVEPDSADAKAGLEKAKFSGLKPGE